MARTLRQRTQRSAQIIRMEFRHQPIDRGMSLSPKRKRFGEKRSATCRDCEATAPFIPFIDGNLYQPAAFEGFEDRRQRGAVHRKQSGDAADGGRLRPIQRHQQRKLTVGEIERTEHIVKASRQSSRGALHVETEAAVAHQMRGGHW